MGSGSSLAVLCKPEVTCCAQGRLLGIRDSFLQRVAEAAIDLAGACDANVPRSRSRILAELSREEERFRTTLDSGEKVLEVSGSQTSACMCHLLWTQNACMDRCTNAFARVVSWRHSCQTQEMGPALRLATGRCGGSSNHGMRMLCQRSEEHNLIMHR